MKVALNVDGSRVRRWHIDLQRRLSSPCREVWLEAGPAARDLSGSLDLLLTLERIAFRLPGDGLRDPVLVPGALRPAGAARDLTIVLDDADLPQPAYRLLFDGEPGETALFAALLAGRSPTIELVGCDGVAARGVASLEAAQGLTGAYDAVMARAISLVARTLSVPGPPVAPMLHGSRASASPARYGAKALGHAVARRLYHLCCHAPHWRVGWRIVDGDDVWTSGGLGGRPWRVLADPGVRFYADPFPFAHEGRRHIFVEDYDHRTGKGVISCVEVGPDGARGYPTCVLEEACHLSYPFVFRHGGEVWMIPETSAERRVSLYRAAPYPSRWVRDADLLTGVEASDATVFLHEGCWWMLASVRDGAGSHSDMLHAYWAPELSGPWTPHLANPVLIDRSAARPAGPFTTLDGRLYRPAQDCSLGYGAGLALAEIVTLTKTRFEQVVRRRLSPDRFWPGRRLHTLARDGDLECIDGSAISWRWRTIGSRDRYPAKRRSEKPSLAKGAILASSGPLCRTPEVGGLPLHQASPGAPAPTGSGRKRARS